MSPQTGSGTLALIERLRLYAQAQRLSILSLLTEGPFSVADIETRTGIGQPALSQQLGALRRAGLIASERTARAVIYDYASPEERERTLTVLNLLTPLPLTASNTDKPSSGEPPRYGAHFASILS